MFKDIKDNLDKHWMLDIESLSTNNNGLVLSIGICNLADLNLRDIYYPGIVEQLLNGADVNQDTIKWWNMQDEDALDDIKNPDRCQLVTVRDRIKYLLETDIKDNYIWAKPPQFDLTILGSMFTNAGLSLPWHWRNIIDVRTFFLAFNTKKGPKLADKGIHHNALDDAIYQAKQVRKLLEVD